MHDMKILHELGSQSEFLTDVAEVEMRGRKHIKRYHGQNAQQVGPQMINKHVLTGVDIGYARRRVEAQANFVSVSPEIFTHDLDI
jgi:hypothetical protein